jgi:epoxyqueuosine reductase
MSSLTLPTLTERTERIRTWARELGFDAVGFAPAHASAHAEVYRAWTAAGMAGEMGYLSREDAVAKRADPSLVVPDVLSAVVVAMGYAPAGDPGRTRGSASRRAFSPATPATTTTTTC